MLPLDLLGPLGLSTEAEAVTKLRQMAPPAPSPVDMAKAEVAAWMESRGLSTEPPVGAQLGRRPKLDALLAAARFLSGREPNKQQLREAMVQEEHDPELAALRGHNLLENQRDDL